MKSYNCFLKWTFFPPNLRGKNSKYHHFKICRNKNSESCWLEVNTHQIQQKSRKTPQWEQLRSHLITTASSLPMRYTGMAFLKSIMFRALNRFPKGCAHTTVRFPNVSLHSTGREVYPLMSGGKTHVRHLSLRQTVRPCEEQVSIYQRHHEDWTSD